MTLTERIAKLEALEKAATPGPWSIYGATGEGTWIAQHEVLPNGYFKLIDYAYAYDRKRHKEAELIIAARNELPFLLSTIRKMKNALELIAHERGWPYDQLPLISGEAYKRTAREVLKSLDEET